MYLDLETVLNAMSRSYHFNFTIIQPPFAGLEHFDNGLRKTLAPDFDFAEFGSQLLKKMPSNTFVTTLDELSCHYMLLKLPEAGDKVYMFGPVCPDCPDGRDQQTDPGAVWAGMSGTGAECLPEHPYCL